MDAKKLEVLLGELAAACRAVTPLLADNCELIEAMDASVEALAPRFEEAIEHLREAIQAQTRLLDKTAAKLKEDAADAVTALETVPAPAQAPGTSLNGLRDALQKGALTVAAARAAYAQVVSAGVDALEAALEGYDQSVQGAATGLSAELRSTTDELQGPTAKLDAARAGRLEQEQDWAEAIDALVAASAETLQPLAKALADGADEVASALVADVNTAIDAYHEVVAPWGPVHPRFMVKDGDLVTTAREALEDALDTLGLRIAQRQEQVELEETALMEELVVVGPSLAAPADDLQAVAGVNG